jgi:hypothetical protein
LVLTLREEYRLRVFKNMVLRKIFRSKTEVVTEDWEKMHSVEPHDLYFPNAIRVIKSRMIRWEANVTDMKEKRNEHRVCWGF